MRRFLALVLAGILMVPSAFAAENTGFSDVAAKDWFAPYVGVCVDEGLMQGTGKGKFEPKRYVTMAECVMLAVRLSRLLKGENGPLPPAPEGWGSVVITDESGTERFTLEDYQGYRSGGGVYTIWLPAERVEPLAGTTGTLTLNGTLVYEGEFTAEEGRTGLTFGDGTLTWREFDAITDGYYLEQRLSEAPKWVLPALYYAKENDLSLGYLDFDLYPADRLSFLTALEGVVDPRTLPKLNTIDALPDIPADDYIVWSDGGKTGTQGNVGDFYRAGILSGTDKYGTFKGGEGLTRAECAAMLARVLRPELRLRFTLKPYPYSAEYTLTPLGLSSRAWWNSGEVNWQFPETVKHPLDQQLLRVSRREGSSIDYDENAIFTLDGTWLVEPGRYGDIDEFGPDGLARVATTHNMGSAKYGVINTTGREIIAPTYDWVSLGGDGVIAAYTEAEHAYTLFDALGRATGKLSAQSYGYTGSIREGLAYYKDENGLWGYKDQTGKVVIPARFEFAGGFYEGLAAVVLDGKTGYIDHSGEIVIPCQFEAVDWYDDARFQGGAAIVTDEEGYSFLIDAAGKQRSPHKYLYLDEGFSPNGLAYYQFWNSRDDYGHGFVDTQGTEHPMPDYHNDYQIMAFSGGYYLVCWNSGMCYNYMDQNGKLLSSQWFSEASPLTEAGQAMVRRSDGEYCRLEVKK